MYIYLFIHKSNYFQRNGFTSEVVPIIESIIQSTIDLYRSAIINLPPTPSKSHYLFNLRDISKVMNGILMFRKESFTNRKVFVRFVIEIMYLNILGN